MALVRADAVPPRLTRKRRPPVCGLTTVCRRRIIQLVRSERVPAIVPPTYRLAHQPISEQGGRALRAVCSPRGGPLTFQISPIIHATPHSASAAIISLSAAHIFLGWL
jgi:hypothetical protein